MFGRVLFPIDFSERSLDMFERLPELRRLGAREVIIMFVTGPNGTVTEEQRSTLDRLRLGLENANIAPREIIVPGDPADEISKAAEREAVDLIAMASSGKGRAKELVVGSTSFKVVRSATRPVLLNKTTKEGRPEKTLFQRVLVPLDLTTCSEIDENVLPKLIDLGLSEAVLFHVVPSTEYSLDDEGRFEQVTTMLDERKERLLGQGCKITTHVHFGTVSYNILEAAREVEASIIIMGLHRRSLLREVAVGGNFEEVIRKSPLPVMVVPCEK